MAIPKMKAKFPEPLIKQPEDMHVVKFAHLNKLISEINIELANLPEEAEPAAAVANATDAASVITQFNALLNSLRAAGIIDEDAPVI